MTTELSSTQQKILHIAVGSTNPSKVSAVKSAFEDTFPSNLDIVLTAHSVPSMVSAQPKDDEETKEGAKNRAIAAFNESHHADFGVGIEGGITFSDSGEDIWCMAWMVIVSNGSEMCWECRASDDISIDISQIVSDKKDTLRSYSKTASFLLPPQISCLIRSGMELGDADDCVFKRVNSKHGGGTVGILTCGLIERSMYYDHALKLALIPWMRPSLYFQNVSEVQMNR